MFGPTIDYHLLRPLCHSRGLRTSGEVTDARPQDRGELLGFLGYFEGRVDLRGKSVLDVGCGTGEMVMEAAQLGAARAVGVDLLPRWIALARERVEGRPELRERVDFVCADIHAWEPAERFDVVISRTAFEHIHDPGPFLHRLVQFLAPGGMFATLWQPFHGPFGDHLGGFFRVRIPYRGVLFNERALLRLRAEFFRPGDPVERWGDIDIGMNRLRYSEFVRLCRETGLEIVLLRPNLTPRHRRLLRPLMRLSDALGRIPIVRDYVAAAPIALLRRPAAGPA
ncbi:MAG TPA: class I SAM-dependent methyltransferase [Longimicrobiaceae bacterium]|nr:class I SAM-dependent methyltransferase [Longimicrobiaceae bacterium]